MKVRILSSILIVILSTFISLSATENRTSRNQATLLIENLTANEILHLYILDEEGEEWELDYTQDGNTILPWDDLELSLLPGEYELYAEYNIDGTIYEAVQFIAVKQGKNYAWEITESLWEDYQYNASYNYLDYDYLDYAYL